VDHDPSPGELGSLAHRRQAHVVRLGLRGSRVESGALVAHLEHVPGVALGQDDLEGASLGVSADVRERLLTDPIQDRSHLRRGLRVEQVANAAVVDQVVLEEVMVQGGGQPVVERERAQLEHRATQSRDGVGHRPLE